MAITTHGGSLSATSTGGGFSDVSLIKTTAATGPDGGVSIQAAATTNTGSIQAGSANISISGSGLNSTGAALDTFGDVTLTANAGSISNFKINNASGITASATNNADYATASVTLTSDSVLNATDISANTNNCAVSWSCNGATVNLTGALGVNVGVVSANAPATSGGTARTRTVFIDGRGGPILAMSPASQIAATDVTLQTNQGSGNGIGTVALPINVDAERNFTFKPNGDFEVVLNGSGPNQLDIQPGLAASASYTGHLTKGAQIGLDLTVDTAKITVDNFSITSGFNAAVYGWSPSVSLSAPITGGNIAVRSISSSADYLSLAAEAGTIGAAVDNAAVEISSTGVISLVAKSIGASVFAQPLDLAGGAINLTTTDAAGYIGSSGAANPVTAATTLLTVDAAGKFNVDTLGADLHNLTVSASPIGVGSAGMAQVTSGLGDRTIYGFASDGTGFTLGSVIPGNWSAPATQFAGGGTLDFTAKSGNVKLDGINFAASGGNLTVRANQLTTGAITQIGGSVLDLGSGVLTLRADGPVALDTANLGGLSANYANFSSGAGCVIGRTDLCGVGSFTSGALTDPAFRNPTTFEVFSRDAINTGDLAADNINLTAYSGDILTRNLSGASGAANSVHLRTDYGLSGNIQTDTIEARSTTLTAYGNVTTGTINWAHPNADYLYIFTQNGNITTASIDANSVQLSANGGTGAINVGNINANAATTYPNDITINADTSITTGSLDAYYISIGGNSTYPSIRTTGAIGSHLPGYSLNASGSSINIGGTIDLDTYTSGETLNLYAQTGDITTTGNITTGQGGDQNNPMTLDAAAGQLKINGSNGAISMTDGSYLSLHAGNTDIRTPFAFARIDAGASGGVTVDAPAGIVQNASGWNDGITAGTVTLRATTSGSAITGAEGQLKLHDVTDLKIETGGDVNIRLTGGEGAPELASLDLTRSDSGAYFRLDDGSLNQLNSTQYLSVSAAEGGGVNLGLGFGETDTSLNFRYRNADNSGINAGDIYGQGIYSNGGKIKLVSDAGRISTGNIDSTDSWGNGGRISLHANAGIDVSDMVNAGSGAIKLKVDSGNIITSGEGSSLSADSVRASAGSGDIGSFRTPLEISANSVKLHSTAAGEGFGGNVYANLSGTSRVKINADNGFDVTSDTRLNSLSITTRGDGGGDTSISAGDQSFDITRNGNGIDVGAMTSPGIGAVISATPLNKFSLTVTSGDIHVYGTGASLVPADTLSFHADGNLFLDGTDSSLVLSNARQYFSATRDLTLSGAASISASDAQSFGAGRDLSVIAGAGGGETISISNTGSGNQTFSATRNLTLSGGSSDNESLSVINSGGGNQSFTSQNGNIALSGGLRSSAAALSVTNSGGGNQSFTSQNGNITISGGGDSSSVDISSSGGGTQTLAASGAGGQIILTGGSTGATLDAAYVSLTQNSDSGQVLTATGGITLTGGDSDGSYVAVQNNGSGLQQIGDASWNPNQTPSVTLQGGAGTGSYVRLESAGEQWVTPVGTISVLGGSGDGSYALIKGTQSGNSGRNQLIGHPGSYYYYEPPYSPYIFDYYHDTPSSITVTAGSGLNAYAEISATGQQSMFSTGTITVSGNTAAGSYARVTGAGQDVRAGGLLSVLAGGGNGADALIVSSGANAQNIEAGSLALTAAGDGVYLYSASARIASGGSQQIYSAGTSDLTAGAGPNSIAEISAAAAQSLSFGDLTLRGGSANGAAASISAGTTQDISAGTIALTGGSARGADAFITAASGQTISAGDTSVTGGSGTAAGDARAYITNLAGVQYLDVGDLSVASGADYGAATVSNWGSAQYIYANSLKIQTTGGSSTASVTTPGAQYIETRYVDVSTAGGASGNAELRGGSQVIHTTDGTAAGGNGSLYVAALGSGTAKIVSDAGQVLEIDYPELMQGTRDGRITVGNINASGHSLISAVHQDVFARSITVVGGSAAGATSAIDVSGTQSTQSVSLVSSTATPTAGLTLQGGSGAGSSALIDPAIQNIVSNGAISVNGGSGSGSIGGIIGSGGQTVLVTSGGANSIDVSGGTGASAFGQITTTGYVQRMGTSGGIVLSAGGGANADAIVGASGSGSQSLVVCTTGSCAFSAIVSNPFVNPVTEVGVFANPITGTLADVTAAIGNTSPQSGSGEPPPFDLTSLLLWNPTLEMSDDDTDNYFWRRLPVCR